MQIAIARHAQLQLLCWNRPPDTVLDGPDALAIYERNWRHVDMSRITPEERALIDVLIRDYGNGVFLGE